MAEPSANPNALAAPAEGFGQTVSFAFDPRGEPPQMRPITSRGPSVSASGVSGRAPANTAVRIEPTPPDPTAALLMKAGEDILNKQLDQARSAEFVQGMQRAMSGEAILEVKDSVPWYAKLFGDTPVIEGARAYTAQDTVNKTLARETANIKGIASMDAVSAGKHFAGVMQGALTGDSATDAIVMKGMTEQMPALMKAQAKANYAFNQGKARQALSSSMASGAKALQEFGEMYASDQVSEKDMKTRAEQFVMSVLPPDGIDEESYQKTVTETMLGMAGNGQFHAIEALRSTGITRALTNEQANRVDKAVESNATRLRDRYAFQYSRTIAEIKSDAANPPAGQTPAQLNERIQRANGAFQKLTGSPVGLFTSDQTADMLAGNFNAFKAEEVRQQNRMQTLADRNATAGAKAAAAEETATVVRGMVSSGDWALAKKLPGVSGDDVDLQVYKMAKDQPQAASIFLRDAWAKGNTSTLIAEEIQAPLNLAAGEFSRNPTSPPPDSFFEAVTAYREMSLAGGPGFANAYFGEHAKAMSYANYMLKDNVLRNPNAPAIYQQAMRAKDFRGEKLSAKEQAALVAKVTSEGSSWLPEFLGGTALREDAVRFLSADVSEGVSQWMAAGMTKDEATALSINDALGTGSGSARAEVLGGYYIPRTPGSSQERLSDLMEGGNGKPYTAIPEETRGEIFSRFLTEAVKLPPDPGTTKIHRLPDVAGTPQFVVDAIDKDGKTTIRTFTGDQLQTFSALQNKKMRAPLPERVREALPAVKLQYGPQITFKPGEGAPSPYADAADWAEYRARQQKSATSTK